MISSKTQHLVRIHWLLLSCLLLITSCVYGQLHQNTLIDPVAYKSLAADKRSEYLKFKAKAAREFSRKKYFSCIVNTRIAEQAFAGDYELSLWRGLCYIQIKDYRNASVEHLRILKKYPRHIAANVNSFELYFKAHQFGYAIQFSNNLRRLYRSKNFPQKHIPLLEFKRMICLHKQLEQKDNVAIREEISQMSYLFLKEKQLPYQNYVSILTRYLDGRTTQADQGMRHTARVFSRLPLHLWDHALVDAGVIEEFRQQRLFYYHDVDASKPSFVLVP